MFAYLKGIIDHKDPTSVVLDVNGVGYQISIPLSTYEVLPSRDQTTRLLIHYYLRDDSVALYGFATKEEKNLFLMLTAISGIGPKLAITIMSGTNPTQFRARIISGDVRSLTLIPGIGVKTAKRIIIELREKFVGQDEQIPEDSGGLILTKNLEEALKALIALGYRRGEALESLQKARKIIDEDSSIEEYIKTALTKM